MVLASSPGHHIEGVDKIFSFESVVAQRVEDATLSAGTNVLQGTAVGDGKIWKITQAVCFYNGTPPSLMNLDVSGLAVSMPLISLKTIVSDQRYWWIGELYLEKDDFVQLYIEGATLNNYAALFYAGVQMNVP